MKPFRIGVNVLSAGSRAEWADKARKLEDLGYWALTVPDHLADIFAPMPALVSVAAATKTLRVGPRLLTLAAQEADIVGLSGVTFRRGGAEPDRSGFKAAGVDERLQLVREVAGDRYDQLELNALVQRVIVTDHRRRAAEELTRRWTELNDQEILQSPYALIGTVDQIVEDLEARRERWGISSYAIHEPYADTFAPVVARLAGR